MFDQLLIQIQEINHQIITKAKTGKDRNKDSLRILQIIKAKIQIAPMKIYKKRRKKWNSHKNIKVLSMILKMTEQRQLI
jgi:hypothetical protein